MSISRRTLLSQSFMGLCPPVLGNLTSNYELTTRSGMRFRKSVHDPAAVKDIDTLNRAAQIMQETMIPDGTMSWWEAITTVHRNGCPHGNWFFLPWHRAFMHNFETAVQHFAEDPSFAVPYWDWNKYPTMPDMFSIGSGGRTWLIDTTRTLPFGREIDTKVLNLDKQKEMLALDDFRSFAGGASWGPRPGSCDDSSAFSGVFENGPHNIVHNTIGGHMPTMNSPRDPVFWAHHSNIDRVWHLWQKERRRLRQSDEPEQLLYTIEPLVDGADLIANRDDLMSTVMGGFLSIPEGTPTLVYDVKGIWKNDRLKIAYVEENQKAPLISDEEDFLGAHSAVSKLVYKETLRIRPEAGTRTFRFTPAEWTLISRLAKNAARHHWRARLHVRNVPYPETLGNKLRVTTEWMDIAPEKELSAISFFGPRPHHGQPVIHTALDMREELKFHCQQKALPILQIETEWTPGDSKSLNGIQLELEISIAQS